MWIIAGAVFVLNSHPVIQSVYCLFALPLWWMARGRPIF